MPDSFSLVSREMAFLLDDLTLEGNLCLPREAKGMVIFAHGSGSSRHSPRNRYVAEFLNKQKIGTLLIDLLTKEEEEIDLQTRELRFNIPMLANRLVKIAQFLSKQPEIVNLKIGYFGASTGGGAALIAAAQIPEIILAVVSRGGRPDLAGAYLKQVLAPTLLIVGELDSVVMELNKKALALLNPESQLKTIPAAAHLFEETGALEKVAEMASGWFKKYLE